MNAQNLEAIRFVLHQYVKKAGVEEHFIKLNIAGDEQRELYQCTVYFDSLPRNDTTDDLFQNGTVSLELFYQVGIMCNFDYEVAEPEQDLEF